MWGTPCPWLQSHIGLRDFGICQTCTSPRSLLAQARCGNHVYSFSALVGLGSGRFRLGLWLWIRVWLKVFSNCYFKSWRYAGMEMRWSPYSLVSASSIHCALRTLLYCSPIGFQYPPLCQVRLTVSELPGRWSWKPMWHETMVTLQLMPETLFCSIRLFIENTDIAPVGILRIFFVPEEWAPRRWGRAFSYRRYYPWSLKCPPTCFQPGCHVAQASSFITALPTWMRKVFLCVQAVMLGFDFRHAIRRCMWLTQGQRLFR